MKSIVALFVAMVAIYGFAEDETPPVPADPYISPDTGLFNECRSVGVHVPPLNEQLDDLELEPRTLREQAVRRLRAARIFDESTEPPYVLHLQVRGTSRAYSAVSTFRRQMCQAEDGNACSWAGGWQHVYVGTHGGSGQYVAYVAADSVDRFVADFLDANREACDRRFVDQHASESHARPIGE